MAIPTLGLVSFTVRDASSNPIAGARVAVRNQVTGAPVRLYTSATASTPSGAAVNGEIIADANGLVTFYALNNLTLSANAYQAGGQAGQAPIFSIFDIQPGQTEIEQLGIQSAKGGPLVLSGSRALANTDLGMTLVWNSGSGANLTINSGLAAGFYCHVVALGTGMVTFVAGTGTFTAPAGATRTSVQNSTATLRQVAANAYSLSGSIA